MSLLAELDDPQKYVIEPEAVVLDEHTQYRIGQDGKPTDEVIKVFDRAYLEKLAANNNRRDKEGAPCAMTIGHTKDDAPETEQPPVVGYWRKHRVGFSPEHKRYCLYATPYIMAQHVDEARTYPRASIEHWRRAEVIDPIAILRRTPERAIQWHFAAGDKRYSPPAAYGAGGIDARYRYAMELGAGMDPTGPPSASAPGTEEVERWMKCCMKCFPNLKDMHDKHAMAPGLAAPGAGPMPEPSADNKDKFAALEAEAKAAKDKLSALEAQAAKDKEENKALRETVATMEKGLREGARKADLDKLAMTREFDPAAELAEVVGLPADQYAAHVKRIETRYQRKKADPTAGQMLQVDADGKIPSEFTADHWAKANKYMQDNHERLQKMPFDQRLEKAKKFAMTGKDTE